MQHACHVLVCAARAVSRAGAVRGTLFGLAAAALVAPALDAAEIETKLQICGSCHGADGKPDDPTVPILWGQQKAYLEKELHDYRSGDRDSQIMSSMAESLRPDDIAEAAAFYADKPWPGQPNVAPGPKPGTAAACAACHGEDFLGGTTGGESAPRLAGQTYQYLADAMGAFATGERRNHAAMAALMMELSAAEREAIARYLSGLRSAERDRPRR